jgi:hypothetical protein
MTHGRHDGVDEAGILQEGDVVRQNRQRLAAPLDTRDRTVGLPDRGLDRLPCIVDVADDCVGPGKKRQCRVAEGTGEGRAEPGRRLGRAEFGEDVDRFQPRPAQPGQPDSERHGDRCVQPPHDVEEAQPGDRRDRCVPPDHVLVADGSSEHRCSDQCGCQHPSAGAARPDPAQRDTHHCENNRRGVSPGEGVFDSSPPPVIADRQETILCAISGEVRRYVKEQPRQRADREQDENAADERPVASTLDPAAGEGEQRPCQERSVPVVEGERGEGDVGVGRMLEVADEPGEPGGNDHPPTPVPRPVPPDEQSGGNDQQSGRHVRHDKGPGSPEALLLGDGEPRHNERGRGEQPREPPCRRPAHQLIFVPILRCA